MRNAVPRFVLVVAMGMLSLLLPAREQVPEKLPTHTVKLNGQTFTLPAGFEIELVAGPPLISRPITADLDDQGRLYVTEANGAVTREDVAQKKPMHRILRLEDTKGTGKFDRVTVFADRIMFPEGTMWHKGSLYVATPPSIWKLTDTDGDGVADQRVEWFQGKTLTGCANDLHGPYLGPEGWIYWCKGAFAQQTYEMPGKKPFVTRASHIFRARPDGSGIEPVMTGGMDNPVDIVFTPGGERIFTTTFLVHPGGGQRDGLIHAIYGGINGKDHAVIHDPAHRWTGPGLMPVLSHLGPAVPSGLVRYESSAFGGSYQDNLFTALFNLHKVSRHILTPDGATFRSRDEDFVVSDSLDFHPTDVLEDADGSLLIIDTGGWYRLCCPSSQLHKPDVPGAIYRVRRKGAAKLNDPRGLKVKWATAQATELTRLLDDPRPVVRKRAIQFLGERGAKVVPTLAEVIRTGKSAEARRNAVWAATRIDHAAAREAVRHALSDAEETVRQAALHSVSVLRDAEALAGLVKLLAQPSAHNRRAAAEALGRLGKGAAIPALFRAIAAQGGKDRVLEHSLIYALIEIGQVKPVAEQLSSADPSIRRAALTVLDQVEGGKLEALLVAGDFTAADSKLRETAWWIASRHPEWGESLARLFRQQLFSYKASGVQAREELLGRLPRFAAAKPVQELLADLLREWNRPGRRLVLRAMAQANLKTVPSIWIDALPQALADGELARDAINTIRAQRLAKPQSAALTAALLRIADDPKAAADLRIAALEVIPGGLSEVPPAQLELLLSHLTPERDVAVRSLAATVLARAKLTPKQLLALTESLKAIGPMELERLLEAFSRSTEVGVGKALLTSLSGASARGSLRVEVIKQHLMKYPAEVQKQAEGLYAVLDVDAVAQRARLEQMLTTLKTGDVRRGQKVFHGQKGACAACHAIGYLGGKVGPDLTRIGGIRSERDLLEAIVFPSASLVRSYEPVLVTTSDGKSHNGLLRQETADEIVLVIGADQQLRIARKDVEQVQPSKVSVMPSGLDQQLTPQELADLVAFLRACK